jgi:hypothetical protein
MVVRKQEKGSQNLCPSGSGFRGVETDVCKGNAMAARFWRRADCAFDRDFDCGKFRQKLRREGKSKEGLTFTGRSGTWQGALATQSKFGLSPTSTSTWLHGNRVCGLLSVAAEHLFPEGIISEYQTGGGQ